MAAAGDFSSLRIFLVEDHPDTLKYLEMYLRDCGHEVRSARSREEAMTALAAEESDVLLTDIGLHDGDGWQLVRELRDQNHLPPFVIAMSGFGMSADRRKSAAAGFHKHLLKPLDPNQLDQALAEGARELRLAAHGR